MLKYGIYSPEEAEKTLKDFNDAFVAFIEEWRKKDCNIKPIIVASEEGIRPDVKISYNPLSPPTFTTIAKDSAESSMITVEDASEMAKGMNIKIGNTSEILAEMGTDAKVTDILSDNRVMLDHAVTTLKGEYVTLTLPKQPQIPSFNTIETMDDTPDVLVQEDIATDLEETADETPNEDIVESPSSIIL